MIKGLFFFRPLLLSFAVMTVAAAVLVGCTSQGVESSKKAVVVARVNGSEITLVHFTDALALLESVADGVSPDEPAPDDSLETGELRLLKEEVLNELIEEELILQYAAKNGLLVNEEELGDGEKAARSDFEGTSFDDFIASKYGSLTAWRVGLKRTLLITKVIDSIKARAPEVGDGEAESYYKENIKKYQVPEQVRALMIVLPTKEEANAALKRLKKENFKELAKELSKGPEALRGGDLGFFGIGDMPGEFEDAVFSLKKGKTSKVIESPYGFHIFKLVEKKKGRKLSYKDVKDKIMASLAHEKAEMEYVEWILKEKQGAEIEMLADL